MLLEAGAGQITKSSMGIPFQYDNSKLHEQIYRVCAAARKAWKNGRRVYVGVGAVINKPNLLREIIAGDKDDVIRCVRFQSARR